MAEEDREHPTKKTKQKHTPRHTKQNKETTNTTQTKNQKMEIFFRF